MTAQHADGVFLALKYEAPKEHEDPFQEEFRELLARVCRVLEGRAGLSSGTDPLLGQLFTLRLKAIDRSVQAGGLDLRGKLATLATIILDKADTAERAMLVRHMCYALDVQRELLERMEGVGVHLDEVEPEQLTRILALDFDRLQEQLRQSTLAGGPDLEKWLRASLRTELGLLMGDAVLNNEARISAPRWYQVNAFLVNAASELRTRSQDLGHLLAHG